MQNNTMINDCYSCMWLKQRKHSMHCRHPKAIKFNELQDKCTCGRTNSQKHHGCGKCTGRGIYCYPTAYSKCDCGGFRKTILRDFNKELV